MAGLRLLAMLALAVASLLGCFRSRLPAEIVTPRLAGYVVDKRTGEGIAGAELFVFRFYSWPQLFHTGGAPIATTWTTSDATGYFELPRHVHPVAEDEREGFKLSPLVFLYFVHRDYTANYLDLPESQDAWTSLRFEIEPEEASIEWMQSPSMSSHTCGLLAGEAYAHCCEILYGDPRCE